MARSALFSGICIYRGNCVIKQVPVIRLLFIIGKHANYVLSIARVSQLILPPKSFVQKDYLITIM